MRILLVEDDELFSNSLVKALERESFTLCVANSGANAEINIQFDNVDIVILDLGLPDIDGIDLLSKIRKSSPSLPVLILTARDQLDEKILGLDKGADDYLVKPFELAELVARLRVIERRLSSVQESTLAFNGVELDVTGHTAKFNQRSLNLSRKEFSLLKALMESAGRVLTKDSLEARLYSIDDEVASNALEVHVHNLRKKIDKSVIKTIRGIGYTIPKG